MPSPQECQQLKEDFSSLSSLGEEFESLLEQPLRSDSKEDIARLERLEELKKKIIERKEGLREKLWPLPELPRVELESQYNAQIEILDRTNLLVNLSNGELGIKIQAQEYPLPSFQEITQRLREKREILKNKINQGFNQIQITPLVSIDTLKQTLSRLLIEHHKNHKLFKTRRNPQDKDEVLDLDVNIPLYVYEEFKDDKLLYYPKAFDPDNHQGITKEQLIAQTKGFNIILTEKDQFLPQENDPNNLPKNNRKRIENNKNPREYLDLQQTQDQYKNESYLIIEDWLTQFITHLEKTNQVSNDWNDNNATWLPGNYLPPTKEEKKRNPGSLGGLPGGSWSRGDRRARVGWDVPGNRDSKWGVGPSVRI